MTDEEKLNKLAEEWATSVIKEMEAKEEKIRLWKMICVESGIENAEIMIRRKK